MERDITSEQIHFRGHGELTLAAEVRGDRQLPTVILLHGGGQTRHSWGGTAADLARRGWHTVSLDARGHGESDWAPDGDYRLSAFALDLGAVIEQLATSPFLVGASLGGLTSLFLEGELAPGSCEALVLVDVVPEIESRGAARIQQFMDRPEGFASLDEAADAIAAYNPHRERPTNLDGLRKNLRLGEDGRWRWHWDPSFLGGKGAPSEITDTERLTAAARSLRVPTLLVRGRMSDIVSEEGADRFLEDVPHAEFVDVSGAGHMVAGDRNDAFTGAVSDFLDDARPKLDE